MKKQIKFTLAILIMALVPVAARAQSTGEVTPADLSVPDSPAFVLLDVTPQTVTRPATPKAFAASLLQSIDVNGKLQSGVALDTAPFLLSAGNNLTIDQYRKNSLTRILAGSKLSIASTKETSGDARHLAAGLHVTLFDLGDPRKDDTLVNCFNDALQLGPPVLGQVGETVMTDVSSDEAKATDVCRAQSAARNWNRSSWIVAGGQAWLSASGADSALKSDGSAVWSSLAWGFESLPQSSALRNHAQLIVHVRWRNGEHVTDSNNVTTDHDRRLWGARLRVGSAKFNGSLEAVRQSDDTPGIRTHSRTVFVGIEQRLFEGTWLDFSFGRESGRFVGNQHLTARSSLHWSFNSKMQASPIPLAP